MRRLGRRRFSTRCLAGIWGLSLVWIASVGFGADWQTLTLPETETYARWYLPASAPIEGPHPVIVFLHGSGSTPEAWLPFLEPEAEALGAAFLVPKSISEFGWGVGDDLATLRAALDGLEAAVDIDRLRIGLGGHSSGGAYAYVAGLSGRLRIAGVFSFAAPFRTVLRVDDSTHRPAVRLYYGAEDPNYAILPAITDMLDRLDIDWEAQVAPGYGHSGWPPGALTAGFQFLLDQHYPGPCVSTPNRVCLREGRFSVEVAWKDHAGLEGSGQAVPGQADDSALFWFFNAENWELLIKVIDGCGYNDHYWVFGAAATDVEYTIRVQDLETGIEAFYSNPLGRRAPAINDTSAMAVCDP